MRFLIIIAFFSAGCVQHLRPLRQLSATPVNATAIAWSADASLIAWGGEDGIVRVSDVPSGKELARTDGYASRGTRTEPTRLGFSPDNRLIAFGSTGGVVRVWDWRAGSIIEMAGHTRPLLAATFTPDGKQLVTASGGLEYLSVTSPTTLPRRARTEVKPAIHRMTIIVFDVRTRTDLSRTAADGFLSITFSPDTRLFAGTRLDVAPPADWPLTFNSPYIRGAHLQVCQTGTGQVVHELRAQGWNSQFSPDGKLLLSEFVAWDVATGRPIIEKEPQATVFLGNEQLLVVKPATNISLWPVALVPIRVKLSRLDVRSSRTQNIGEFEPEGGVYWFSSALQLEAHFSPDRKLVVDRAMKLWRVPQ